MRLLGIDGAEAANEYRPEFMADCNQRFAVAPRPPEDAHRPVPQRRGELVLILSEHRVLAEGEAAAEDSPAEGRGQAGAGGHFCFALTMPQAPCTRQRRMLCSRLRSVRG